MTKVKVVGDLQCQHNPYLKTFKSKVVFCEPWFPQTDSAKSKKKNKNKDVKDLEKEQLYSIELEDSILFPEGGGQPWDLGTLNELPVVEVRRKGLQCLHITKAPLELGSEVTISLDFERRWDYMQQHSGQHLLSAVFEKLYNLDTISWLMGDKLNYIELPIKPKELTVDMLKEAEKLCNTMIRESIPVTVESVDLKSLDKRPDSLPEDYGEGILRYISIGDVDRNACCGTHVTTTSHLQAIKLSFNLESNSGGASTRLFFMVGERVLSALQESMLRDFRLNELLSTRPEEFGDKVSGLQTKFRDQTKQIKSMSMELAELAAQKLLTTDQVISTLHRPNVDPEFMKWLLFHLKPLDFSQRRATFISSAQSNANSGSVVILGHADILKEVLEMLKELDPPLKGALSNPNRWQGKCMDLAALTSFLPKVSDRFETKTENE